MRCFKQPEQCGDLLLLRGGLAVGAEIIAGQVGKAEFFFAGEFPREFELYVLAELLPGGDQFCGRGFFKLQQRVHGLDLDALARVQLDLEGAVRLRQNAAGQKLAGLFKQYKQNVRLLMVRAQCNQGASSRNSKMAGKWSSKSLMAWSPPSSNRIWAFL